MSSNSNNNYKAVAAATTNNKLRNSISSEISNNASINSKTLPTRMKARSTGSQNSDQSNNSKRRLSNPNLASKSQQQQQQQSNGGSVNRKLSATTAESDGGGGGFYLDGSPDYKYVEGNNKAIKPVIKRTLNDFDFVDDYPANENYYNTESFRPERVRDQLDNLSIATLDYFEQPANRKANKDDIIKWNVQRNNIIKELERSDYSNLFLDKYFDLGSPKNDLIKTSNGHQLIKWLRPIEIVKNPILGIDSTNYKDVVQGILEDCALISAFDTISKYPNLLRQVLTSELDLNSVEYKGCIRVNLWVREEWISIYIDDRLPTINGKLCYSRCSRPNCFWVPLLEKAFAKLEGNYEKLIGIDPAYALVCLTGGLVLRLNPTHLNDREPILHYLNNSKDTDLIVGVVGSELIKNEKTERATVVKPNSIINNNNNNSKQTSVTNKPVDNRYVSTQRIGHSYSLIDVIHFTKLNKAYVKLRNCQISMKVYKEVNNERDVKLIEKIQNTLDEAKDEAKRNGIMYFSYEEFFDYFEVITLVVLLDRMVGPDRALVGNFSSTWTPNNSLMNAAGNRNVNLLEKYISSPHFLFQITNNDPTNIEAITVIMNIIAQNFNDKEFMGSIVLPVRNRIFGNSTNNQQQQSSAVGVRWANNSEVLIDKYAAAKLKHLSFVNYSLQRQTLSNTNPLCTELKLLPGKYFIGLVIQSSKLPKNFTLRLATPSNSTIKDLDYSMNIVGNDYVLFIKEFNETIKIVLPCCCVCSCILDKSYISSGAKVFCQSCYNAAFRCEICNTEVGIEYYTLEQRISCKSCLKKYKDFIEKTNFGF